MRESSGPLARVEPRKALRAGRTGLGRRRLGGSLLGRRVEGAPEGARTRRDAAPEMPPGRCRELETAGDLVRKIARAQPRHVSGWTETRRGATRLGRWAERGGGERAVLVIARGSGNRTVCLGAPRPAGGCARRVEGPSTSRWYVFGV